MASKNRPRTVESLNYFAKTIYQLLKSDRTSIIAVAGYKGSGKSTFSTKLEKEYAKISKTVWGFDRMTWSRKELLTWIDGKGPDKKGQLPEYSAILPDELFRMFYKRTWFEKHQIDAITVLNMCRDRHLLLCGNVPNLWDLDAGFLNTLLFYVYIPKRGVAWVFQKENNPFSTDQWNVVENKKAFRKYKNPYSISNFVCEIHFEDWDKKEKEEYYKIRNLKRVEAIEKEDKDKERYSDIKKQRDEAIRGWVKDRKQLSEAIRKSGIPAPSFLKPWQNNLTDQTISEYLGINRETVRLTHK